MSQLPTKIHVLPIGEAHFSNGVDLNVDVPFLSQLAANSFGKGCSDIPIVFGHPEGQGSGAAGWANEYVVASAGTPEYPLAGLWITDVKWTAEAAAAILAGKFKYISPSLGQLFDIRTGEPKEGWTLLHVGLVENPAFGSALQPLVAAANVNKVVYLAPRRVFSEEPEMDKKETVDAEVKTEAQVAEPVVEASVEVKQPEPVVEQVAETVTAEAELITVLAEQLGVEASKDAVLGGVIALKASVDALQEQAKAGQVSEEDQIRAEAVATVEAAVKEGKLLKCQKESFVKLAAEQPRVFKIAMSKLSPVVVTGKTLTMPDGKSDAAASVQAAMNAGESDGDVFKRRMNLAMSIQAERKCSYDDALREAVKREKTT